jgi:hypothetical protein
VNCDKKLTVIVVLACVAGQPRWRVLPLEMLPRVDAMDSYNDTWQRTYYELLTKVECIDPHTHTHTRKCGKNTT